jgi:hypothetical protein
MHATEGRGAAQERRQTIGRVRTRRTAASSARSNARQCGKGGCSIGGCLGAAPVVHGRPGVLPGPGRRRRRRLVEVTELDPKICLYCTGVHVLTLVFLGIVLAAPAFAQDQ